MPRTRTGTSSSGRRRGARRSASVVASPRATCSSTSTSTTYRWTAVTSRCTPAWHPTPPYATTTTGHPLAHPFVDGSAELRHARLHKPDGRNLRRVREGLSHREHPQQRSLPVGL